MAADLPEKIDVVELGQPIGVVEHHRPAHSFPRMFGEIDDGLKLGFHRFAVGEDLFLAEHLAHFALAGGIPDHGGSPADERDRLMPRLLQVMKGEERNHMTDVKAFAGRIHPDVHPNRFLIHQVAQPFQVGARFDKSPIEEGLQGTVHLTSPLACSSCSLP